MPSIMANEPEKDPIFVMNSLSEQTQAGRFFSSESLEDRHSTTSSTESNPSLNVAHRKDHEFIPTRMKTIAASKPAADPTQFTRVTSNPLLISAQKQLMKVEEVKKKKEIIPKRGDDEPDWQSNLSSWKDRRRKQSEEALQRVAEVKALEGEGDDINQRQKLSIGKKLSSLMYTSGDDDWSDLGLEREPSQPKSDAEYAEQPDPIEHQPKPPKKHQRQSLPTNLSKIEDKEEVKKELEEITDVVRSLSRNPLGGLDGYGEGVPVLNRKTSAPVMPYGSPRSTSEEKEPPPVRRKSSELSSSMKSRLEAFTAAKNDSEDAETNKRVVEPDNTFRQKLQNFRKISEPQPEPEQPQGPKPKLSYKNLIGNNFSESNARTLDNNDHENDLVDDDVDQLLDDALEESYRAIESPDGSPNGVPTPPTEKPPPPPTEEEHAKNRKNLEHSVLVDQDLDKQEQEIIASLELEEREHKKYMDRRALSPQNVSPALSSDSSNATKKKSEQPPNQPQQPQHRSSYNQHWLIQEAEQRRISEQQMRYQQQQSPVYENSNYIGGMPQMPAVPPPSQYTNHQRPPPPPAPSSSGSSTSNGLARPPQQPSPVNENMYANLGQHPPLPSNYQREIPPGPPTSSSNNMRGLPGPQVPPRNTHSDGTSPKSGSSDRLLSVSGKKKCSHCGEELGRGAAMIIESLRLFYHLRCFRCVVCHVQLGNGSKGTDVRVRNNKLHCQNCYSNDEGLKFSKV